MRRGKVSRSKDSEKTANKNKKKAPGSNGRKEREDHDRSCLGCLLDSTMRRSWPRYIFVAPQGTADAFNMATSYQQWVWEREANINWSMVTCQGSTRSELP